MAVDDLYFNLSTLKPRDVYKLLTAAVVPRPIAFVTTRNDDRSVNAAPFSFFNMFSEDPPIIALGIDMRPDGALKDTARNIRISGEFVVNLVDQSLLDSMVACAAAFPEGESETEAIGLELLDNNPDTALHIASAPFSLDCQQISMMRFGNRRDLVIGEVHSVRARGGLVDPDTLRLNWDAYAPVARLFASMYAHLDTLVERPIPTPAEARSLRRKTASKGS